MGGGVHVQERGGLYSEVPCIMNNGHVGDRCLFIINSLD